MKKGTCLATVLLVSGATLLLLGCVSTGPADAAAQAEIVRQGIVGRAGMVNRADVQGLIDSWDENGLNMPQGSSPTKGKEALAAATRTSFDRTSFANRVHDVQQVHVINDEWAFSWGYYSDDRNPKAGGATKKYYGKHLVILKRQPDGSWKKYIDCANDEPPPK